MGADPSQSPRWKSTRSQGCSERGYSLHDADGPQRTLAKVYRNMRVSAVRQEKTGRVWQGALATD